MMVLVLDVPVTVFVVEAMLLVGEIGEAVSVSEAPVWPDIVV